LKFKLEALVSFFVFRLNLNPLNRIPVNKNKSQITKPFLIFIYFLLFYHFYISITKWGIFRINTVPTPEEEDKDVLYLMGRQKLSKEPLLLGCLSLEREGSVKDASIESKLLLRLSF
jgi:hypothetical protein